MAEPQQYQIRNVTMLVVAGVLGLLAVIMVNWHIYNIRRENDEDMVQVLQARVDLLPGEVLEDSQLEVTRLPKRLVPTDDLMSIAFASDKFALLGMEVNQNVAQGRIIRWDYVTGGPSKGGTERMPGVGLVLVPLDVTADTAPNDLHPGDYVNLLTTVVIDNKGTLKTMPVMQKVLVKRVSGRGGRVLDQVSVEVGKPEADKLFSFKATGRTLMLVICNPGEKPEFTGFNPELESLLRYEDRRSRNPY